MCDRFTFLHEKADNFRAFLLGQHPDAQLAAQLAGFSKELLLPTLTTVWIPALEAKGADAIIDELMAHLTPTDPVAVRSKVLRYFQCFKEVLTH